MGDARVDYDFECLEDVFKVTLSPVLMVFLVKSLPAVIWLLSLTILEQLGSISKALIFVRVIGKRG